MESSGGNIEGSSAKKDFLDSFERERAARFKEVIKRDPIVKQKKEEESRKESDEDVWRKVTSSRLGSEKEAKGGLEEKKC